MYQDFSQLNSKVVIRSHRAIHVFDPKDILAIKAAGSYSLVFFNGNKCLKFSYNTSRFMAIIAHPKFLVQVHRSNFINVNFVTKVESDMRKYMVFLKHGHSVRVSHTFRKKLFEILMKK